MPILPIDLQTLFTQMSHVGKAQSVLKEGAEVNQGMQGLVNLKNAEIKDSSVNQAQEVGDGLEKVKDEKKEREKNEQKDREEKAKEKSKKFFTDPDCGNNIDITR